MSPFVGNPVAVVLDGDGLDDAEMHASPAGRTCRRRRSCCPRPAPMPTTGSASSRPCDELPVRRPPDARHVPRVARARRPAGGRRRRRPGVRGRARAACAARGDRLAFAAPPLLRSGAGRTPSSWPRDARRSTRSGDDRRGRLGRQRARLDRPPARRRRRTWPRRARRGHGRRRATSSRPRRDAPAGRPPCHRGPRVLPEGRHARRGPRDRQPERVGSRSGCSAPARPASPYVASQGGALGRAGRVHVSQDGDGTIWIGGGTVTCIAGHLEA